jgi:hypothetical protein
LSLTPGRCVRTRVAGLFLFLPLLGRVQFDHLVSKADYPGSKRIPATSALLSLLALKLLDKERRSHINDFNFDEALGLFAGLNIPPKKSYATEYSYGTVRDHQQKLLGGWVGALAPLLFPQAKGFAALFSSDPISWRCDRTGATLPTKAWQSRYQRVELLRPGTGEPRVVLCQRQLDPP